MKNQIKLGGKVIVSDPCYEVPTWCQEVIKNVRPGMYDTEVDYKESDGWGKRVHTLTVLHENIKSPNWEHYGSVGVDSGQMGVFCMTSYRNDDIASDLPWLTEKGDPFGDHPFRPIKEEGEQWYVKMCDRTLTTKEGWGTYDTGVVSSSGYGDGSYELQVCQMDDLIHGFRIIFIDDSYDEEEVEEELFEEDEL
jgi:hypothetical protein